MTEDQKFEFATIEYKEVCQNIRESWSYTTTLLRHYLFIQILLLSLVGLGNSAITNTGAVFTGTIQSKTTGQTDAAAQTEASISLAEKEALGREARMKKWARYGTLLALILIGGGLSLGAWRQSRRIFFNSTNFVKRAAAIESQYGIGELSLNAEKPPAMHVYMLSRLNDKNLFPMEKALSVTYGLGGLVWVIMGFLFFIPFIA
jgi:hypothetical protein